jgi:hypothetical protein
MNITLIPFTYISNLLSKALLYKKLLAILSFAIIIVKIIPYFNFDLKCLQKAR